MWIRNRDRNAIIQPEHIWINVRTPNHEYIKDGLGLYAVGANREYYIELGVYSKEQAFEILDDIQMYLTNKTDGVYQMPKRKESEEAE